MNKQRKTRRRGSAMILTLGMLTMIVVFVLTFTLISIQHKVITGISQNITLARIDAENAIFVIYRIHSINWSDITDPENVMPSSKHSSTDHFGRDTDGNQYEWDGRYYYASTGSDNNLIEDAFHIRLGGQDFTPDPSKKFLDASNTIGWVHVTDPNGSGGIVSRICWLVIDQSGRLDPNQVTQESQAEADAHLSQARIGAIPGEIDLVAAFSATNSDLAKKFQYEGVGIGERKDKWFSWFNILRGNSSITDGFSDSEREDVFEIIFPYSYDIESYFDGEVDKHRFDLVNADWDAMGNRLANTNIIETASNFWEDYDTEKPYENLGGIPWLAWRDLDFLKEQLAANFIDFFDSDSYATVDDPNAPLYVGLEKIPYINEVHFECLISDDGDGTYSLTIICTPEMVNMYDEALGSGGELVVNIGIEGELADRSTLGVNPISFTWSSSEVSSQSYLTEAPQTVIVDLGSSPSLTNFKLAINTVIYRPLPQPTEGAVWDFAFDGAGLASTAASAPTTNLVLATTQFVSAEINDPRNNLESTTWEWSTIWSPISNGSLDNTNTVCSPNPGGDTDVEPGATDPWDVSTAYIPNAPPTSLWELGAIHRVDNWQTLNLDVFNPLAGDEDGFGAYAEGDANILAQVKLHDKLFTHGTVNANTYSQKVLQGLLYGISYGGSYKTPNSGSYITVAQAQAIAGTPAISGGTLAAGEWLYENGSESGTGAPFMNRGMLANVLRLSDGTVVTQTNDRAKEELIGKIVNLVNVRQNYFTVMITAQRIKDLPTTATTGTFGTYDHGIDRIEAEQKILITLYRDGFSNRFRIHEVLYLDEF